MAAEERTHPELDREAQQELWGRLMDERHRLREQGQHGHALVAQKVERVMRVALRPIGH